MTNIISGQPALDVTSEGRDLLISYLVARKELIIQVAEFDADGLEPSHNAYAARDDAAVDLLEQLLSQMDLSHYRELI